jgi:hypothetical protein
MPTWKKVIVSGSNAHLTSVTASQVPEITNFGGRVLAYDVTTGAFGYINTSSIVTAAQGGVTSFSTINVGGLGGSSGTAVADNSTDTLIISSSDANITITATAGTDTLSFDFADSPIFTHITASGNISGSGNLSITGNETIGGTSTITGRLTANGAISTTNITASGNISSSAGLIGATLTTSGNGTIGGDLTVTGDVAVNGGDITTTSTGIATIFNANATTLNIGGAATTVAIGATSGTTTVRNNLTVTGDLTVNGTTTTIDTSNLTVEDKFIILAHGSGSLSPFQEGGIIIEGSTGDIGQAFVFNSGSTANVTGRWGIAANVHATSSDVTPTEFMVSATSSGVAPSSAPTYGGSDGGYGNMHIQTNGDIWIYS